MIGAVKETLAPGLLEKVAHIQQERCGFPDSVRDAAVAAADGLDGWAALWALSDVIAAWQRTQRARK